MISNRNGRQDKKYLTYTWSRGCPLYLHDSYWWEFSQQFKEKEGLDVDFHFLFSLYFLCKQSNALLKQHQRIKRTRRREEAVSLKKADQGHQRYLIYWWSNNSNQGYRTRWSSVFCSCYKIGHGQKFHVKFFPPTTKIGRWLSSAYTSIEKFGTNLIPTDFPWRPLLSTMDQVFSPTQLWLLVDV